MWCGVMLCVCVSVCMHVFVCVCVSVCVCVCVCIDLYWPDLFHVLIHEPQLCLIVLHLYSDVLQSCDVFATPGISSYHITSYRIMLHYVTHSHTSAQCLSFVFLTISLSPYLPYSPYFLSQSHPHTISSTKQHTHTHTHTSFSLNRSWRVTITL